MSTKSIQITQTLVQMTGPHPGLSRWNGRPAKIWQVVIVSTADQQLQTTVYRCMSYRRAVSLSCNMARDRNLFLHIEALPQ